MDQIIGRVEIDDELGRDGRVRLHKHVDERAIHRVVIDRGLPVAGLVPDDRAPG